MCELLGMNANVPTDIRFSFAGFALRGGAVRPNADGWGIAFYDGAAVRTFHDPLQCAASDLAQFIRTCPIRSSHVIAHVRRANRGRVALANTHPFTRELWGRVWTFAHNGQLRGVKKRPLGRFAPIGTTDSEHAFCWLMNQLAVRWTRMPPARDLDAEMRRLFADLGTLGVFNVLVSDGRSLYAHCGNHLSYVTRQAPFGPATLADDNLTVDFSQETTPDDVVTVVATRPLTRDEHWTQLDRQQTLILRDGRPVDVPVAAARRSLRPRPPSPVPAEWLSA